MSESEPMDAASRAMADAAAMTEEINAMVREIGERSAAVAPQTANLKLLAELNGNMVPADVLPAAVAVLAERVEILEAYCSMLARMILQQSHNGVAAMESIRAMGDQFGEFQEAVIDGQEADRDPYGLFSHDDD